MSNIKICCFYSFFQLACLSFVSFLLSCFFFLVSFVSSSMLILPPAQTASVVLYSPSWKPSQCWFRANTDSMQATCLGIHIWSSVCCCRSQHNQDCYPGSLLAAPRGNDGYYSHKYATGFFGLCCFVFLRIFFGVFLPFRAERETNMD